MNLLVHIVKKDIRRFRLSLACGLFIAALPVLFGLLDALDGSRSVQLHAAFLNLYFRAPWALPLFVILMTAIVNGDENPVSTTAFWLTRPISPQMVLKA